MEYRFKLQQFDGPLDLLLHLIEEAQVDIRDIFVSEITAQYLSYMDDLRKLDMDKASEFLTMAATLLYIKSRSLLPKIPRADETELDPEEALILQLREYKAFKRMGESLSHMRENMKGAYKKLPEEFPLLPGEIHFLEANIDALYGAFLTLLKKEGGEDAKAVRFHEVRADQFTVRRQISMLREKLALHAKLAFEELFDGKATKLECIVTFMALLDMLVRGEISIKQSAPYGRITIYAKNLLDDYDDAEYMDEGTP